MIGTAFILSFGSPRASIGARASRAGIANLSGTALALAVALATRSRVAAAQRPSNARAGTAMGTYALATTQLPSANNDGCWLEVAPVRRDSVHLQLLCRKPAPGHHLGVLDARVPMRGDTLLYERGDATDRCRIAVRFAANIAVVVQDGTDRTCGFGAFVNVSGSYTRLSARPPRFDLAPIERALPSRRPPGSPR